MTSLTDLLSKHALHVSPAFNAGFIRNGAQWFTGKEAEVDGRLLQWAAFGDFSRNIKDRWTNISGDLSQGEQEKLSAFIKEANTENRRAKEEYWEKIQATIQAEWDGFSELGTAPYLEKKCLSGALYGCRVEPFERGARLIVPARDSSGNLWGYQRIFSEKLSLLGTDKVFREGARKESCFHRLGAPFDGAPSIYLCEGISTAISVLLALPDASVASCFDADNLVNVSRALRKRYPDTHFCFCADDDRWPSKDGQVHRTGETKARQAAKEVGNSHVVLPVFDPKFSDQRPTDFDDVRRLMSLDAVRDQILNPKGPDDQSSQGTGAIATGAATPQRANPGLLEAGLVNTLLAQYQDSEGSTLIRQGKDFFHYQKTHWVALDPLTSPDYFKTLLDRLAAGRLKFKDILSAYNRFFIHVPTVPPGINMFSPNPFAQNFTNGTVHLLPRPDGTFDVVMHPHRRTDYLIHCHEFNYREEAPLNDEFERSLDRIWEGELDIEKKKQAYFEVLGACLISAFRKIVLFVGRPKSGKSTLVLFAVNMVHEQYRCSVDPTQLDGFNLESMAGKLLNFDTDINLVKPIKDSILKKVEDRCPIRIRRKKIADIYAPIPGVHLLAANRMPVSQEGAQAYDRRLLVFRCERFQPPEQGYIQDYAQHVWKLNCQGIVARAIQGLKRLAANGGHFTIPESSRAELAEWKHSQGDIVQDFLTDVKEGGVSDMNTQVLMGETCEIKREGLWSIFKAWGDNSAPRTVLPGKIKFYSRLIELGIKVKTVKGVRHFSGIGVEVEPGGVV